MNGGPSAPTAADYANSAAQSAQSDVKRLKDRVAVLEAQVRQLLDDLMQRSK